MASRKITQNPLILWTLLRSFHTQNTLEESQYPKQQNPLISYIYSELKPHIFAIYMINL